MNIVMMVKQLCVNYVSYILVARAVSYGLKWAIYLVFLSKGRHGNRCAYETYYV
jgi:hypothetical protein